MDNGVAIVTAKYLEDEVNLPPPRWVMWDSVKKLLYLHLFFYLLEGGCMLFWSVKVLRWRVHVFFFWRAWNDSFSCDQLSKLIEMWFTGHSPLH